MTLAVGLAAQAQAPARKPTPREMTRMLDEMHFFWSEARKRHSVYARADALRPQRRDTPLRYLNISDEEVREVQAISLKFLPRAMVNISPVVTDCPCEEGPTCTAQVYIVATTGTHTRGLQLSRMNERWTVGTVQQWWSRRAALVMSKTGNDFVDQYEYQRALHELYGEFPVCAGEPESKKQAVAAQQAETKQ
jgi:hypothetical protein